jgi:hypothetical protein
MILGGPRSECWTIPVALEVLALLILVDPADSRRPITNHQSEIIDDLGPPGIEPGTP